MTEYGFAGIYDQISPSVSFRWPAANGEVYNTRPTYQLDSISEARDRSEWRTYSNGTNYHANEGLNKCPTTFNTYPMHDPSMYAPCFRKPVELYGEICQNTIYTNQCGMRTYSIEDFQGHSGHSTQSCVSSASHVSGSYDSRYFEFIQPTETCSSAARKNRNDSVKPSLVRPQRSSKHLTKSKHLESSQPYKKRENVDLIKHKEPLMSSVPPDRKFCNVDRVFIWDLELTLDIFSSLLNSHRNMDLTYWNSVVERMEEMISSVADNYFFQGDLEKIDQVNIEDTLTKENDQEFRRYIDGFNRPDTSTGQTSPTTFSSVCWVKKLSFRYRRIKEFYENNRNSFELLNTLLGPAARSQWLRSRYDAERMTNGWMSLAFRSLSIINSRTNCRNVLVTNARLVPTITRVLLYGLSGVFSADNIYSVAKIERGMCFEQISSKFGIGCTFVVVGGGREQEIAAKQMDLPFWRVSFQSDLHALQHALQLDYL